MKKKFWFSIFVFLSIYLTYSLGTPFCFSDCGGYVYLMGKHPLTQEYFHELFKAGSRPWFIPFFYSLFGPYSLTSAMKIQVIQTLIAFLSWILISIELSKLIKFRHISFVLFLPLMFISGAYLFNKYLLSDSLSLSLTLIYLTFVFRIIRMGESSVDRSFLILVVLSLLLIGARDSNKIIIFTSQIFIIITLFRTNKIKIAIISSILIFLFILAQSPFSKERHKENMLNIISGFVLPNTTVSEYFVENGMPKLLAEKGVNFRPQKFSEVNITEMFGYRDVVKEFSGNFLDKSSGVYFKYILSNPFFVLDLFINNKNLILEQYWNKDGLGGYSKLGGVIFWPEPKSMVPAISQQPLKISPTDFIPVNFKIIILAISTLVFFVKRNCISPQFLFLSYLGIVYAVASFISDLWEPGEMARHSLIGGILFSLGIWGLILQLLYIAKVIAVKKIFGTRNI